MINKYTYFEESRVLATRHLNYKDKQSFVNDAKHCIKNNKFDIADRYENYNYLQENGIDFESGIKLIERFLVPNSVIAVLNDVNEPGTDLFLCILVIPTKPKVTHIYLKIKPYSDDTMTVISFHSSTEKIRIDYSIATDYYDNSFIENLAKEWKFIYNKYNDNLILNIETEEQFIRFTLSDSVSEKDVSNILKSIPSQWGIDKTKMYNSYEFEDNTITFEVFTKSFNKG